MTINQLIEVLQESERCFEENNRQAQELRANRCPSSHWWRAQARELQFKPDPAKHPGIDRIQFICYSLGLDLTAAAIRKIAVDLYMKNRIHPMVVMKMSLIEAAGIVEGSMTIGDLNMRHPELLEAIND